MNFNRAIDRYLGHCARSGLASTTCARYRDILDGLSDIVAREAGPDATVEQVTRDHCELYLDRFGHLSPATKYLYTDTIKVFFEYCRANQEWIERSPAEKIPLPKRQPAEDLDVVTVDETDVGRMFAACDEVDEFLTLALLCYLGPRRSATANLRWRDLDLGRGTARFREKGGKVITKPIPAELAETLYQIALSGQVPNSPDDYVIPNRTTGHNHLGVRFTVNRNPKRNNKVVYNNVKRVADRAGVDAHPHALRAAFAVHYLDQNPGDLDALQRLMGHADVKTTRVYLRRQNKFKAMERIRPLSWAGVLQPSTVMPPAGFEPAVGESPLAGPLRLKLDELKARHKGRRNALP